jgi:hypothetical protein
MQNMRGFGWLLVRLAIRNSTPGWKAAQHARTTDSTASAAIPQKEAGGWHQFDVTARDLPRR